MPDIDHTAVGHIAVGHTATRHAVVAELLDALEALLILYRSVPEADRVAQWSAQAERITAELGCHLQVARGRLPAHVRASSAWVASPRR